MLHLETGTPLGNSDDMEGYTPITTPGLELASSIPT